MAGKLLLPIASGISVRDPATMRETRTIRYPRAGYDKASHDKAGHDKETDRMITLRVLGERIVEQWGSTVAVYGPPA